MLNYYQYSGKATKMTDMSEQIQIQAICLFGMFLV